MKPVTLGVRLSSVAWIGTIAILAATLTASGSGSAGLASPPWQMYQADAGHSGYVPFQLGARSVLSVRWQRSLGSLPLNPIAAVDGKVFVSQSGSYMNARLFGLDATNGAVLWNHSYGLTHSVNPPSAAGGRVYLQTCNHADDTYLWGYNAENGEQLFQSPHEAQWEEYYAPTIYDGTVYANGGYYGGMYAFDAATGQQLWFRALPQYDQWTPAVDSQYAYAYVGDALYVLDRFTGDVAFTIPDPHFEWQGWSMNLAPVLGSTQSVLAIQDSRLVCFDLTNHSVRWEVARAFSGQPAAHAGTVYAISEGSLAAHDEATGHRLWTWKPPSGKLGGEVLIAEDHLIVKTDSAVFAVSTLTHRRVASFASSGHLAVSEGLLYVAKANGTLLALGLGAPHMALNRKAIAFGPVRSGDSVARSVRLHNRGSVVLTVLQFAGLIPPYQYDGVAPPFNVPAGQSVELLFRFTPDTPGLVRQTAILVTNDPKQPQVALRFSGRGLAPMPGQ